MLQDFFPYRLAVTSAAFSRLLVDVYQRRFGLGRDEWRLLYLLADVKAETSLDLGRNTSLDKVQVSRAADRLLRKGLIRRSTSDLDRRLWLYACTPEGRAMFHEVRALVDQRSEAVLCKMSADDRAALGRGLAALDLATKSVAAEIEVNRQARPLPARPRSAGAEG
ncbi:MarR family winged helix-turn-helix transcriptional regulator [Tabrizicola sp.]|uniref:MarR family winged helix-turn-helix transcriptional regulator n=1 Tax=Tabrizicola sp. TaxID=2005166 RepID=UPI002732D450|nr:MarR family transcriptional regulator [Tabrizicola sp.]MDP3196968.1 MarR family transcriptional regulator [Tabrizicola sp.]